MALMAVMALSRADPPCRAMTRSGLPAILVTSAQGPTFSDRLVRFSEARKATANSS